MMLIEGMATINKEESSMERQRLIMDYQSLVKFHNENYYDCRGMAKRIIKYYQNKKNLLKKPENIDNDFVFITDDDKRKLEKPLILEDREKLFTVEFCLKDKTTVRWGAYKTKEEAEIVYKKVDAYFKKTFEHFYKNLDNQEIYSL